VGVVDGGAVAWDDSGVFALDEASEVPVGMGDPGEFAGDVVPEVGVGLCAAEVGEPAEHHGVLEASLFHAQSEFGEELCPGGLDGGVLDVVFEFDAVDFSSGGIDGGDEGIGHAVFEGEMELAFVAMAAADGGVLGGEEEDVPDDKADDGGIAEVFLDGVEIAVEDGEVEVIGAVGLGNPTDHGLFVAVVRAADEGDVDDLGADLTHDSEGTCDEFEVLVGPRGDVVFELEGVGRLDHGDPGLEMVGVGE